MMRNKNTIQSIGGKGVLLPLSYFGVILGLKHTLKRKFVKIFAYLLIIFIINTQISLDVAFARSSGGGDLAEFDVGKFAIGIGINLGAFALGSVVSAGMQGAVSGAEAASSALSSLSNIGTWASAYNASVAATQLSSGISMMGANKGWDPAATMVAANVAGAMAGGAVNPSAALGTGGSIAQGAVVGAAQGGTIAALSDAGENYEPWMGAVGGLAGSAAGGMFTAAVGVDVIAVKNDAGQITGYRPAESVGEVFSYSIQSTINPENLINEGIDLGVAYATEDMDRQDANMITQGVSGFRQGYYAEQYREAREKREFEKKAKKAVEVAKKSEKQLNDGIVGQAMLWVMKNKPEWDSEGNFIYGEDAKRQKSDNIDKIISDKVAPGMMARDRVFSDDVTDTRKNAEDVAIVRIMMNEIFTDGDQEIPESYYFQGEDQARQNVLRDVISKSPGFQVQNPNVPGTTNVLVQPGFIQQNNFRNQGIPSANLPQNQGRRSGGVKK